MRFAFSPGQRLIEPGLGVPGNALVVGGLTFVMPLLMAAVPFLMVWSLAISWWLLRWRFRSGSRRKLPPGVLRCLPPCGCRRQPSTTAVDPAELPAFIRRQLDPPPPRGLPWRWWR